MCNILIKYANDLLVPEHTECTLTEEFTRICDWPQHNKMRINITKTKELVFHRPHPTKFDISYALDGIVEERAAKLLGVFLSFDEHVNFVLDSQHKIHMLIKAKENSNLVLTVRSQRTYLLKLL